MRGEAGVLIKCGCWEGLTFFIEVDREDRKVCLLNHDGYVIMLGFCESENVM